MTTAADIANRHLLQAEGLQENPLHLGQRVRIVVGEEWVKSRAGQLLASCLVNLLSRQAELVSSIAIVAPTVDSLISLPNGNAAGLFPECLTEIASWAVKQCVKVVTTSAKDDTEADITVMIGTRVAVPAGTGLFAIGNGWKAWVGLPEHGTLHVVPDKANPMGPFLAAALAAGEVFKRGRGLLSGRFLDADGYSLWSDEKSSDWMKLQDGPEIAGSRLRPIHVIGAGAVGNGLAYVLANAQLAEAFAVLVDDDTYDDTSLNRCFLAGWRDVEDSKVDAVAAVLKKSGIGAYPFRGTISQYLMDARPELRPDVARQADQLTFDIVVSCVDRGKSRQDVQGLDAALLFGGSTLGLSARANFYPKASGKACLSCFNPAERDGDRLRALEKTLREMDEKARANLILRERLDLKAVEEYLANPRCGSMGEAALRDLATRSGAAFSVGFVSLGAALLLAAKLLRQAVCEDQSMRGDVTSLNFKNGGFLDSFLAPDDNCEWGCQRRRAQ